MDEQSRRCVSGDLNLGVTQVLHFLRDLRRFRREGVLVVSQHHVLDEELTHRLQGDFFQVHPTTFDPQQPDVPGGTNTLAASTAQNARSYSGRASAYFLAASPGDREVATELPGWVT